jgi:TonB family protein
MPITHTRSTHRRRSGHGSTIAIVVGLHVLMGAAIVWIATTETGQRIYKEYKVKFYQPPKKEERKEEVKKEEPPPPKPEPKKADQEEVPDAPMSRPEERAPSEEMKLGGDSGDPFSGGPGKAIDVHQAYYLSITSQLRGCFREPPGLEEGDLGATKLEITVDDAGNITGQRIVGSSGFKDLDRAALDAVKCVGRLKAARPKTLDRTLTVKFIPP